MVKTLAYADFTHDMAVTLQTYFAAYARDGVVRVEITDHGLWLHHPDSATRQFLGSAFPLQRLKPGPSDQKSPHRLGAQ